MPRPMLATILRFAICLACTAVGTAAAAEPIAAPHDPAPAGRDQPLAKAAGDSGDPGGTAPLPILQNIRLQVVRTGNTDGTDLNGITEQDFADLLPEMNQIYQPVGIRFVFDPLNDFVTIQDTQLNKTFAVPGNLADYQDEDVSPTVDRASFTAARRAVADQYRGKLVLFYALPDVLKFDHALGHWTTVPTTTSASSHNERHISIADEPNARVLAHEIGHYLHLIHPFVKEVYTVQDAVTKIENRLGQGYGVEESMLVLDGDWRYVEDTPADASVSIWDDFHGTGKRCDGTADDYIPLDVALPRGGTHEYRLQPNRWLTMSYFWCPDSGFTPQEMLRVHDAIDILNRHDLVSEPPTSLTHLVRKGSAYAGAIVDVEAVRVGRGRIVTLVKTSNSMMKVIPWDVGESGTITRAGAGAYAGPITDMVGASMGLDNIVTAVRNSSGELEIITWKIHPDGTVEQLDSVVDIPVKQMKIARFDMLNAVTAVQMPNDDLKVIAWQLDADGTISRLAEADAGEVDGFDISASWLGVTTSVRDGSGNLRVINWQVRRYDNWQITRKGTWVGQPTESLIDATGMDIPSHGTTAYTDAFDWLRLSTWGVDYAGGVAPWSSHHTGIKCSDFAAERLGTELLAIGCRAVGNSNLLMTLFHIGPNGLAVSMLDHEYIGTVSDLSLARAHKDVVVSAVRNGSGNLQLIAWKRSEGFLF